MKQLSPVALAIACLALACGGGNSAETPAASADALFDIPLTLNDGSVISLSDYEGRVLLVVNVASRCGFTPQYEGLQTLHERYAERGLSVLAFPANDFMSQEPGSDAEIREFCTTNYGVSFPLFAKISVKGEAIHPLYRQLVAGQGQEAFSGEISWNFNKFLIDREGRIVARFGSRTKPHDDELLTALEAALGS